MTALRIAEGRRVAAPVGRVSTLRAILLGVAALAPISVSAWLHSAGIVALVPAVTAYRASLVAAGGGLEGLGLDVPPLPVLLALPAAAIPSLRWSALAPAVVASLAAALAVWSLAGALRGAGAGPRAAVAVAAAVAVQPLWLFAAASGSSQLVAAAFLVAGARGLLVWLRTRDDLALAASSFAVAAAMLARYDAVLIGVALSVIVGRVAARGGKAQARATVIGYLTPILGVAGLWVLVVSLVSGDPLGLLARAHAAVAMAPDATWSMAEPLLALAALAVALAGVAVARDAGTAVVATVIGGVAIPPAVMALATGAPMTLDDLVPLVPLLALVAARPSRARPALAAATLALALAAPAAMAGAEDRALGHREAIAAAVGGATPMWPGEREIAAAIGTQGPGLVLLDDRVDVIVALLVGDPGRVVGMAHRLETAALLAPATVVDLVLVRAPAGRAEHHRVARALPTAFDGGLGWQLLADGPVSGEAAEYRLYRTRGGNGS